MLELNGVSSTPLHVMGASLILFRILHAVGLKVDTIQSLARGLAAGGTALILVVASVWSIVTFL